MYESKSIVAVVPAYNEESQIVLVIETMPDFVDKIVIIDDKSQDRMAEVVRAHAAKNPRVVLLQHEVNQGVGGAIATGYKWVRDNGYDIAVVMAGDGQMAPSQLPDILAPVIHDDVDYAKANRLASGDAYQKTPKIRYFGNSSLSLLTKIASGYWHVADSQTGYTAINRRALELINWDKMYKRYGQPNDLLVKLNVANMRVKDVVVSPVYGVGERSKLKVRKVLFTISWLLLKLFFWRLKEKYIIRDFHPLIFFYLLGVGLFAASGIFFVRLVTLWWLNGAVPEITTMVWMFCLTIGLQSVFFAMWFDMESNKHLR